MSEDKIDLSVLYCNGAENVTNWSLNQNYYYRDCAAPYCVGLQPYVQNVNDLHVNIR